jgi:hypothetical protein
MNTNNFQKVFSVNGRLQAIWVESILEQAGVPVSFGNSKSGDYLDVFVAAENAYDAKNILYPERPAKKIRNAFAGI